jgi:ABC-type glycerol-3-phosphate transport system substrate-binding protein
VARRIPVGCGRLAMLGVRLALVLVLGVLLAGCSGSGEKGEAPENLPSSPEEADEVVVRVSGTEGTAYSGTYGTIEGTLQTVDDTVGADPTDYEVEVEEGVADGVTAGFQKTQPGSEELSVEILADDQVVVESRTFAELGAVNADWFPQVGPPEEIPDDEDILFEDEDSVPEEK